jgi:hypothetical protein
MPWPRTIRHDGTVSDRRELRRVSVPGRSSLHGVARRTDRWDGPGVRLMGLLARLFLRNLGFATLHPGHELR